MRRTPTILVAVFSSALIALAGCTSESGHNLTERDSSGSDSTPQPDPSPVVTVVNESVAHAGTESTGDTETPADSNPSTSPQVTDSDTSAPVSSTVAAGHTLELSVEGGEFAEVTLTDTKHPNLDVDAGAFPGAPESLQPPASPEASSPAAEPQSSDEPAGSESASPDSAAPTASPTTFPQKQGQSWTSNHPLIGRGSYEWRATTIAPDGAAHIQTGALHTDSAAGEALRARTVIADGDTVGVAAPIIVTFNAKIPEEQRAAVQSRLSVTVEDENSHFREVEGAWGWRFDTDGVSRVHYRPKDFWPAYSHVSVSLALAGVPYSEKFHGSDDITLNFEVGRDQRAHGDVKAHTFSVERDGEPVSMVPASFGKPSAPSHNGTHVVMSKHRNYTMSSERWGYSTPVTHAVRIHNNGEFVHAAPWSRGSQGYNNVSHGCINLSTANAKEFFDSALYGDPVEISGSSVELSKTDSDISDWVFNWDDWKELSALPHN